MTELLFHREPPEQRDLVTRALTVRANTIDLEARSVEAVLSTGGRVKVFDFQNYRTIEEVLIPEGAELPAQMIFLESHMRYSLDCVIGSIRNIRVEAGKVIGRLFFSEGDERSDRAWNLVRQGHVTDVSIGYRAIDFIDIPPGQAQTVDGKRYQAGQIPLRITRRYSLREGSLVPIGADEAAKIRSELGLPPTQRIAPAMNEALRKYLESLGLRADATVQQAWDYLHSLDQAQQSRGVAINEGRETYPAATPAPAPAAPPVTQQRSAPPAAPPAPPADADAIVRAERDRVLMCRSEAAPGVSEELIQRATSEGWDETRVRREYLGALRQAQPATPLGTPPAGHVHGREVDVHRQSLAGALMMRMGIDPAPLCRTEADTQQWERAMNQGERLMAFSAFDFCREAVLATRAVDPETGMQPTSQEGFIRAAMSTPTIAYAFTTSVNARLLGRYEEETAQLDFVEIVDVPDFKSNEAIALGKLSGLDKLPRGKTAKHATFADNQETYRVHRYAKQMVIDDQDIIDDNLSVFSTIPDEMALAAARILPDMVFYLFLANPTLASDNLAVFHTTHANTDTNTLQASAIKSGATKMMKQQENGVNLNIRPQYLITGPTLDWTARELIKSTQLLTSLAGDTDLREERGNKNVIQDLGLQLRSDARLENGVTDPSSGTAAVGSATTWFLASRAFRTVRAAYRAGTGRRPQVRRFVLDRGQWGMGWDIAMDVGAAMIGYRGLYRGNT